jgi:putative transcription antitermination factor YqgF
VTPVSQARGPLLAVDIGRVRVGIARSDAEGIMALPETTLARNADTVAHVVELARSYEAVGIVVGLPLTLAGDRGQAADEAEVFAGELAALAPDIPVRLLDERMTTREATRGLQSAGRDARKSRAVIDQAAAVILLNHALDAQRSSGIPAGRQVTVVPKKGENSVQPE